MPLTHSLAACVRGFPQNLPRRRLRRLALSGYSRFCGSLALRTFQCSPLRGSAFQCCAYGTFQSAPSGAERVVTGSLAALLLGCTRLLFDRQKAASLASCALAGDPLASSGRRSFADFHPLRRCTGSNHACPFTSVRVRSRPFQRRFADIHPPGSGTWIRRGAKCVSTSDEEPCEKRRSREEKACGFKKEMAPAPGFEPGTKWLTATYSTIELCRSVYTIKYHGPRQKSSGGGRKKASPRSVAAPPLAKPRGRSYITLRFFCYVRARMAESADAADLKSASRKRVRVQVPFRAPLPSVRGEVFSWSSRRKNRLSA